MHDQCTEKCPGQKKEIILLSQDIPIWDTSYIIMSLLHKRTCKLRPRSPITCFRFQMVKNQLDFSEVFTIKRGTYHNNWQFVIQLSGQKWKRTTWRSFLILSQLSSTSSWQLTVSMHQIGSLICNMHHKLMVKMIILFVLCNGITFYIVKWHRKMS